MTDNVWFLEQRRNFESGGLFMTKKRIGAIVALGLIGVLYAAAIVLAFLDSPLARSCLMAALFCTIVVPAVIYGYMMIVKIVKQRDK